MSCVWYSLVITEHPVSKYLTALMSKLMMVGVNDLKRQQGRRPLISASRFESSHSNYGSNNEFYTSVRSMFKHRFPITLHPRVS